MTTQDSIRTTTVWQTENDIVVPVTVRETVTETAVREVKAVKQVKAPVRSVIKANHGVPRLLAYPYVASEADTHAEDVKTAAGGAGADAAAGVVGADSVRVAGSDSIAADSLAYREIPGEVKEGIILINPASKYIKENETQRTHQSDYGMSWVYVTLAALFCVVGVKFRGNSRYVKALLDDLTDTRLRHNVFDETVKETSLLFLLNVMWAACAGVLLWGVLNLTLPATPGNSFSITVSPPTGIGLCMGAAGIYLLLITIAYWVVGNVFSDRQQTQLWVKGASASYALSTILLFPLALLSLTYPGWNRILIAIAAAVFIFAKIVFLYKGFRIFFAQISSWLLFLYYLCSLEIVPLILTYVAALSACSGSIL